MINYAEFLSFIAARYEINNGIQFSSKDNAIYATLSTFNIEENRQGLWVDSFKAQKKSANPNSSEIQGFSSQQISDSVVWFDVEQENTNYNFPEKIEQLANTAAMLLVSVADSIPSSNVIGNLPCIFTGKDLSRNKNLFVFDRHLAGKISSIPEDFRAIAIVTTYNDEDIIATAIEKLLENGLEICVIDNWSDDNTFDILRSFSDKLLHLERFPETKTAEIFNSKVFQRKEELALSYPGAWIIHQNSDEIRSTPFLNISMREALYRVSCAGFNAVDYTVVNFRPICDGFDKNSDPELFFDYFAYGDKPEDFEQIKAWIQPESKIILSNGYAEFEGCKVFPYKFLIKHYSFRSQKQAQDKILAHHKSRKFLGKEIHGWHYEYEEFRKRDIFIWNKNDLVFLDRNSFYQNYLIQNISGVGLKKCVRIPRKFSIRHFFQKLFS